MTSKIGIKKIILNPGLENELEKNYDHAIQHAKEIYIASAYLTNWSTKTPLNSKCENIIFLVGTDFGITRKHACANVVKWLPKKFQGNFQAVPILSNRGFHPKVIAWKDLQDKYFCIIGSSNLTEAAFNANYEANVKVSLTKGEYVQIKTWIEDILLKHKCEVVDDSWIKEYSEKQFIRNKKNDEVTINLAIPNSKEYRENILDRRKREKTFNQIKEPMRNAMVACADGKMTNKEFWDVFWSLWAHHDSRIQGSGIQFTGKKANWKQACKAFLRILEIEKSVNELTLDLMVKKEIDNLGRLRNPMRGSWFSEMLCHFFPLYYPLLDNPIKKYLKENKWKSQRGLSEGGKYIVLSKKLRNVIKQNPEGPKNMPELDIAIWTWCKEKGLNKGEYGK